MKHDFIYNHLNAQEFLMVRRSEQWKQLVEAIEQINANDFLKISKDKARKGEVLYNQVAINDKFKRLLEVSGWSEMKKDYYVSGDIPTAKEIVKIKEPTEQKRIIEERGFVAFQTYNQVDFVKDRIAVEVQFGKYFSVAYDLHVKHTFFFLRDDIDVGIEIIPTHEMMRRMDSGVSWFENEVANVIREGRNNPSVPIVIIGIEPEDLIPAPKAKGREKNAKKRAESLRNKATVANYRLKLLGEKLSIMEQNYESLVTSVRIAKEEYEEFGTKKKHAALEKATNALNRFTPKLEEAKRKYSESSQRAEGISKDALDAERLAKLAEEDVARVAALKARLVAHA